MHRANKQSTPTHLHFLRDGGEMAEMIGAKDWSATAIGPITDWPSNLRTTLSMLLRAGFPMVLFWRPGPITFYNDACLPISDNPRWPGMPAMDIWEEYWPVVQPLIESVFTTGNPTKSSNHHLPIYRNGKKEDIYWTFNFSPVFDEAGEVDGVLMTCNEESEEEFRQLADTLPQLVWTTDNKGNQTFASRRWKEFTGLDPYNAESFAKMVHPDDLDRLLQTWFHCIETGAIYSAEVRLRKYNGEYHWFYVNGEAIKSVTGEVTKWVGAFTDINEQKKAEDRLKIMIEASELGTWELNVQTKEVHYSERYMQILGYPGKVDLTHEQILKHLHPDDLSVREEAFRQAYRTGALHYESRIIWSDKSVHWIEGKGTVFYDEYKQPNLLIGTLRDITEEKYHQKELEDREQKFRLLADSMPEFVWTGDVSGHLNYFNESVYRYSGLSKEVVEEKGWIEIVHPDDRDENLRKWVDAVHTGNDFIMEHRFRRFDGEYRWQLSRAIPQRDIHGKIQMWVGTSTDIQDMKALDQQKDFFISMASHELKTPITSIKGYVQMLQSIHNKGEDNFLKSSLRVIDKQIGTLTRLISDLLDLSKIKSGNLVLNKEFFPVNELITEIVDEIKQINPDYTIEFSPVLNRNIFADRERVGQVLRNLLTNAVKYSPNKRHVTINTKAEGNNIFIAVEDSGIGISKIDQQKIFQRFYRVEGKNEKTYPGFGIGLFISSEIVERHQGNIGVTSEPGVGSTFYFSLPVDARPASG